jgi:hypothetical protein
MSHFGLCFSVVRTSMHPNGVSPSPQNHRRRPSKIIKFCVIQHYKMKSESVFEKLNKLTLILAFADISFSNSFN